MDPDDLVNYDLSRKSEGLGKQMSLSVGNLRRRLKSHRTYVTPDPTMRGNNQESDPGGQYRRGCRGC